MGDRVQDTEIYGSRMHMTTVHRMYVMCMLYIAHVPDGMHTVLGVAGKQYSQVPFHFSTLLVHSAVPGTATSLDIHV